MSATRVYLIRHGSTSANLEVPYRLQGRGSDRPLDPAGRDQSRRAAGALAGLGLAAVYSSPLLRALETARIVAGPHGLEPVPVEALTEAEIGRWEGLTWAEARDRDPDLHDAFHASPGTVPYPDGESFLDVQRRAVPALGALAAAHPGGSIAAVAHNVVNRAVLAGLLGLPIDLARSLRQFNGGINILEFDGDAGRVVSMNACLHLDTID